MDEKIRERMKSAYKNVELNNIMKNQVETKLLEKSKKTGSKKVYRDLVVVLAAVAVFILVNSIIMGTNKGDLENATEDIMENVFLYEAYEDAFVKVTPYNALGDVTQSLSSVYSFEIEFGRLGTGGDAETKIIGREYINTTFDAVGICNLDGQYYLVAPVSADAQYGVWDIQNGSGWQMFFCDEDVCRDILSYGEIKYFARNVISQEDVKLWDIGEGMEPIYDSSSKKPGFYPALHDWDDKCTSIYTVRDVYIPANQIGKSVKDYITLELFFDDLIMTDFENGIAISEDPEKDAYQVNHRFLDLNYQVSSEPDSDEIISVTLFGDGNYVTEDVRLGMDMTEVIEKMQIPKEAVFAENSYWFAFFERDGLLYELSFVPSAGNGSLSYVSYTLSFTRISDAAQIGESTVKSYGEKMEISGSNAVFAQ